MVVIWQSISSAATIISSTIATNVWPLRQGCA
jgi:hypothetical protein